MIIPSLQISKFFKHNSIAHRHAYYIGIISMIAGSAACLLYMFFNSIPQPIFFILSAILFSYLALGQSVKEKSFWIIVTGLYSVFLVIIFSAISHIIYLVIPALIIVTFLTYFQGSKNGNWMYVCKFSFVLLALCLYPTGDWYLGLHRAIAVLLGTLVAFLTMLIISVPQLDDWHKHSLMQWKDMLFTLLSSKKSKKLPQLSTNLESFARDYSSLIQGTHPKAALVIEVLTSTASKLKTATLPENISTMPSKLQSYLLQLTVDCKTCVATKNISNFSQTLKKFQEQINELSDQKYFCTLPTEERASVSRVYYIITTLQESLENYCLLFPENLK